MNTRYTNRSLKHRHNTSQWECSLSSDSQIRDMIYTVRDQQVMLDSDLAELYEVESGALNRATKRNEDRFSEDFRFRLTKKELENLRCQIGILTGQNPDSSVGHTYLPMPWRCSQAYSTAKSRLIQVCVSYAPSSR